MKTKDQLARQLTTAIIFEFAQGDSVAPGLRNRIRKVIMEWLSLPQTIKQVRNRPMRPRTPYGFGPNIRKM